MFRNPFTPKDTGTFPPPRLDVSSLPGLAPLDRILEADFEFSYPFWKLSDERLKEIVPPYDSNDEAERVLPELVRSTLEEIIGTTHSVADIRGKISTLSGTALLAGEGFVDNPHELCKSFAERHGRLLQVDMDQYLIQTMTEQTMNFSVDWTEKVLKVWPKEMGEEGFQIQISGSAFEQCFRPSTFLRVPRFDRSRFYELASGALETLRYLKREASDTYQTFITTYEKAYNKWMFGS